MPVIDVRDLRKDYGAVRAVDGLSFHVDAGEVYALLGENGAGKSTAVEILEGHRSATSGSVEVLGVDPSSAGRDFRDRIGIVLQSSGVEAEFTVREVITLYGGCYRSPRPLDEVVALVGLDEKVDERVGALSGGQRRRVDLALGIIGRPEVLFLDEPTTGFDPAARRQSWDLIETLGADGTTVLLTTHYLDEAEHLASRVGVLSRGRMIAEGTPEQLINRISGTVVSFTLPESVEIVTLRPRSLRSWRPTSGCRVDWSRPTSIARPPLSTVSPDGPSRPASNSTRCRWVERRSKRCT